MNTTDQDEEGGVGAVPAPLLSEIAISETRVHHPSKANPYYAPPIYKEVCELSDDQVKNRMDYLKLQSKTLGLAEAFAVEPAKGFMTDAISKYANERDALGDHLRRKIVEVSVRAVRANDREHRERWCSVQNNRLKIPSSSKWNGVERRRHGPSMPAF